jgi:Uncharacterized protein conserved in bacteria
MNQIKCPHCGEQFTIDEQGYSDILNQVRSKEFDQEVHEKLEQERINWQKDIDLEKERAKASKDKELSNYIEQIKDLESRLDKNKTEQEILKLEIEQKSREKMRTKDDEITELKHQLESLEQEKKLAISQVEAKQEKKMFELEKQIQLDERKAELELTSLKENHQKEIAQKEETIAFYKDFKAKQSTKMVGESLEQHCEIEFNRLRPTAFPKAEFGKDNDARTGSKGDYIYREYDENGLEIISIMFEMKNEGDETISKKKNEHFFKELDKDRQEKSCEYAVLVSMLEADNDLYNDGIVDVSYAYEKMYVIRPQFFIPMITLLRNAAMNALQYKQEAADMREQNIDISNFEEEMNAFKDNFSITAKNFNGNLEKLDKNLEDSIKKLTTARDDLRKAMKNLGTAENKLDKLSVKHLTKNNPTMQAKFEELKEE